MSEITEIAAKARSLSRNTHDGIAIEEYLLRHLPALSSAAVSEREPVCDESELLTIAYMRGALDAKRDAASELEAENARLKARLAEAMKALEPFAEIAGEAWADGSGWTNAACQNDRICDWFGPSAFHAARRVREGGKVDG